ncbi:MAG TPA: DUF962 domain-containing protein [Acidobacteriota bacterium]|jgi:hypothetical protein
MTEPKSFTEFWPYYLSEHRLRRTRQLHFIGSSLALLLLIAAVWTRFWYLIPVAVVCGYGFAWFGHFFAEKNRPASFHYPLYSFLADWKMWAFTITGRLETELGRLGISNNEFRRTNDE